MMNRSTLLKRLKYFFHFSKFSGINESFLQQRCLFNISKHRFIQSEFKTVSSTASQSQWRNIFCSCLTRSDANSPKQSTNEPNLNLGDDTDFQNILKDFAKDFDVNGESEQILDEIKKSLSEGGVPLPNENNSLSATSNIAIEKYKEFSESDSAVIPTHEDLQSGAYKSDDITYHIDQNWNRDISQMQYKRGVSGVYDIDELVELLRSENLINIAVISIPKELHYTDFLVLATAKSPRHSKAVVEYVLKVYKMKKNKKDPFIVVDGEKIANWKALDMGNIVLHIFLEETRAFYDIESLWLFDIDFDKGGTLKSDPIFSALEEQMAFFDSLQQQASIETKTPKKY